MDTSSPVTSPYDGTTTIAAAMDLVSGVNPKPVTLAVGQNYITADFGYNWGGSIGDLVWWDDNRNGVRDGGEAAIPNAAVLLYFDADNNGILDPVAGDYQIGFAMTDAQRRLPASTTCRPATTWWTSTRTASPPTACATSCRRPTMCAT